ncbi:class I SAM-dependent methyltransferase [Crenothrix polyspora]|uniref:Methylase involved in ubiquinone/menaquinone biosynthesis n=1 Tax=Crenothrix polyspora TaxID=360316 RepID=A0A1R4HJM1_9GAMM|nr:class I SAM-dependent methyltransferase [Crenothrix polyspora]SJM96419.1 Methylase involved in ubiquinone/menaquinone biosynthesis [Crenothrix polyspora]
MKPDSASIIKKYNRLAPFYEGMEAVVEGLFFRHWREKLWAKAEGIHILEVGVGTGKNFAYYPKNAKVTAIDFSPAMLEQAQRKKDARHIDVDLHLMDIEFLQFADNSFDTVVGSFVFCSVPAPAKGLKELHRVCKPSGKVLLLEHVLSSRRLIAKLMNFLNPLVLSLVGANINRNTVKQVQGGAFRFVRVDERSSDIIKLIEALK